MAGEMNGRLKVIWAELADVESRLENLYEALETKQLTMDALSPRILSLRHRQDQLTAAREEAASLLEQRRVDLPGTEEIKGYVADFREFLQEGTFPERKVLIRNFVKGIEVTGDEAVLTYTIPMPSDGVTKESASVLDFVQSGPPTCTELRTGPWRATSAASPPTAASASGSPHPDGAAVVPRSRPSRRTAPSSCRRSPVRYHVGGIPRPSALPRPPPSGPR